MYDFSQHLQKDEYILYQGRPVLGRGSKQVGGFIFVIVFSLVMLSILIWVYANKIGDGTNGIDLEFVIFFILILFFTVGGIWGLVYNLILKKKMIADDYYCITNLRVMKYESKKDKLVFGYLASYDDIKCKNMKNGFGDFYMGMDLEGENDNNIVDAVHTVKEVLLHPNPENMPCIMFESIEKPREVLKIAKEARKVLLDSNSK